MLINAAPPAPSRIPPILQDRTDPIPEHQPHLFNVRDLLRGVSIQNNQVGLLASRDGADVIVQAQELCFIDAAHFRRALVREADPARSDKAELP